MKFHLILLLFFTISSFSCGENFLKLASEYGNYTTQMVRDIEELRRVADDCEYEKECFEEKLDEYIQDFCRSEEYELRGYISRRECERQYPYVFLKLFEAGKYASVDAIQADKEYREAIRAYEEALEDLDEAKEDYKEAKRDWVNARCSSDEECEEAREDWEEAEEDYDEAWDDYDEAWDDYEQAKRQYEEFYD